MNYALVTGGSRGIGRAASLRLAAQGFAILINYVSNEQKARETADLVAAAGGTAELLKFDVANAEETAAVLGGWMQAHPDDFIEVLVNNAGIRRDGLLIWTEPDDWHKVVNTTLDGFYNVTRPLLQPMLLKKRGRIINVASLSGLKGMAGQTNYSAAKGGLIAATKALAQEVGRKKVTVNAIAPGFVKTDMVDGLDEAALKKDIPLQRFGEPEEVAALIGFLASPEAAYITGECISINGGLYS
jgi:3-oxoacyl-[acyl-carrier protein] reductase